MTTSGIGEANLNFAININSIPYKNFIDENRESDIELINRLDLEKNAENIKNLINNYYSYTEDNNYLALEGMFNESLYRYFSKYDLTKNEVMELIKGYNNQFGVQNKQIKIRWNTLNFYKLNNGGYKISYTLDYSIDREDKNKVSKFVIETYLEVTSNFKINSMYEKIISKK